MADRRHADGRSRSRGRAGGPEEADWEPAEGAAVEDEAGLDETTRELDLVEDAFPLPGESVRTFRPRDAEALLDERAFVEEDEFLPYWAELWPAAEGLARALAPRRLDGMRVLELGCGIALPSVVAAMRGAKVLATDWSADALPVVRRNAAANGVEVETAQVAWGTPELVVARAPWPLVLLADVLYEQRMVDLLSALLPRLVGPAGEVLVADSGRPLAPAFLRAAEERFDVTSRRDHVLTHVQVHRLRPRAAPAAH